MSNVKQHDIRKKDKDEHKNRRKEENSKEFLKKLRLKN